MFKIVTFTDLLTNDRNVTSHRMHMWLGLSFFFYVSSSFASIHSYERRFSSVSDPTEIRVKMDIVRRLVDSYQHQSIKRNGMPIKLSFPKSDSMQATGGTLNGIQVLNIYGGIFTNFTVPEIVSVTCHELGHILGQVTLKDAGYTQSSMLNDGVEGEADYFGGSCLLKFIQENGFRRVPDHEICIRYGSEVSSCSSAIQVSIDTMRKIYNRSINYGEAQHQRFQGIDRTYPPAECRLLSVINGILDFPRPSCWYNP